MSERTALVDAVLAQTPWADWHRTPVAGDASARRYMRLSSGKDSVVVMDAPPDICTDTAQFVAIAKVLFNAGLAAPEILLRDLEQGLLVLRDLGADDFAAHLRDHPADETMLYCAATDLLLAVQDIPAPADLTQLTPEHGAAMIDVLASHYTEHDIAALRSCLRDTLAAFAPVADTLALRDFHAENLIWRPTSKGHDRVGLLDFQDAFIAPAGYDLASLLRDARRDVTPETAQAMIARFAAGSGCSLHDMQLQVSILGVQRNLRILGIFARLAGTAGKTKYLSFMDRVWRHITADLMHPQFADLRAAVLAAVPAPTPDHLKRFAQ